eukprot:TRINITY_DN76640_c0_g1_i1.p1 TRINITY_DN76640_c0_g1~~TRINITY_DN76640_c0_g1_i1.p1  ORF type:complete len:361 (-),score=80.20 TRINITY_DN76640_c0_g1_i1:79-1110(-)
MGGTASCGQASCPASCDTKSGCLGSSDMLNEYEPQPSKEVNRESVEMAPPAAVVLKAQEPQGSDSKQTNAAPPPLDDAATDSYFARELQELRDLVPNGADGARPVFTFKTGATYKGQWKGNARHGIGEQIWSDGAKFVGTWKDNFAEGHGLFQHADGDIFVGQWRQSAAEGLGTYYHKKGLTTYRGEWTQDMQHGQGVEQWEGGSKYHGQFHWGKKQGHGIYLWPDGSLYEGQWESNAINGYGHYKGKDGREFRGMWREAVIHGCGKYSWPDGRTFQGQYADDQKHGFGTFTWQDGRKFEGFWQTGKQHGWGVTHKPDGSILKEGMWNMGQQVENNEAPPAAS